MNVAQSLLVVLFAPLVSAAVIGLFLRRQGVLASYLSVGAAAVIAGFSWIAWSGAQGETAAVSFSWLKVGQLQIDLGFLFDGVAATMLLMVAFVGFLIHVFSLGYMKTDKARARFFGGLSIFMFSMLGIVLADNLIMLFIFWELVGFSSYMLIGHYMETNAAKEASKKAFIVNRVGDVGFLIGIVYAYWQFGTTNLTEMGAIAGLHPEMLNWFVAGCLLCGFIGKSAQFPLHVWLPDAMAGPTPVSALIHAATMVAAGVYFLIRIAFLFTPDVLTFIAWLGTAVAVYAGFCAYAQNDIKRILAYSTLSQLGYMAAAFGLGYPGIALFHLITHAFFKALLFLGAGSVIHGCHHEQDIFRMGGLLKRMPLTALTFLTGLLALCGVFGLSGFYSKDGILIAGSLENPAIFTLLCGGAFLTAGYMGRLFWIAFLGSPKSEAAEHAKESPLVMTVPLVLLAVLSVIGGMTWLWPDTLGGLILADLDHLHHMEGYKAAHKNVLLFGSAAWVVGLAVSFFFYGAGAREDRLEKLAGPVYGFLQKRLWFDEIYNFYVAKIQQRLADLLSFFDIFLLKGVLIRGSAGLVGLFGLGAKQLHVGSLHSYVYWFLGGLVAFWIVATGLLF
jgi:NADH-quinone oxidoreductase subunit L